MNRASKFFTIFALFSVLSQWHVFLRQLNKLYRLVYGCLNLHALFALNRFNLQEIRNYVKSLCLQIELAQYLWNFAIIVECLDQRFDDSVLILRQVFLVDL